MTQQERAVARAEFVTLREWAAQHFENALAFWQEFSDRVCAFNTHGDGKIMQALSDLYGQYERKAEAA